MERPGSGLCSHFHPHRQTSACDRTRPSGVSVARQDSPARKRSVRSELGRDLGASDGGALRRHWKVSDYFNGLRLLSALSKRSRETTKPPWSRKSCIRSTKCSRNGRTLRSATTARRRCICSGHSPAFLDSLAAELSYTLVVYAAILVSAMSGACPGHGVAPLCP